MPCSDDDKIELRGFGSFRVRAGVRGRAATRRPGIGSRCPRSGFPYFKPGKELKDLINSEGSPPPAHGNRHSGSVGDPALLSVTARDPTPDPTRSLRQPAPERATLRGRYHIETWGCQMNVHDSEKLAGALEREGYTPARGPPNRPM